MSISLRAIGGNALSILTSDALKRATSLVVYAWRLDDVAFEFGQLSLAPTPFWVVQIFVIAGLTILIEFPCFLV
jgi:hypothetical protein